MADYLPHTKEDVASMLEFLGMETLDDLFAQIPSAVRLSGGLGLDEGMSEPDVAALFAGYTKNNEAKTTSMTCFAGGGARRREGARESLRVRHGLHAVST